MTRHRTVAPDPSAPAVEMLWEPDDPREVLRSRFGFEDPDAAARWVGEVLEERWGVGPVACSRLVMSDRNALAWVDGPQGRMIAKWCAAPERFGRLAGLAELTAWLGDRGQPVSAPVPTREGRVQVELEDAPTADVGASSTSISVGLQRVVGGRLLDGDEPEQARAAGAALARLHGALAEHPGGAIDGELAPAEPARDVVQASLDGERARERMPSELRHALRELVTRIPGEELPTQIVHGDVRAANVLVDGPTGTGRPEVVAFLDLEEARRDSRIGELARSAVLLGTRYHDWAPVPADARAAFLAGYDGVSPLTDEESAWLDLLVLWYSAVMIPAGEDPHGWRDAALGQLPAVGGAGR